MVFRQTARRTVRSGVLWGYVFGLYVATQALAYASSYKTVAQRIGLAKEFGANAGVSALVGPAHDIQTVAGFTVWKCLAVLAILFGAGMLVLDIWVGMPGAWTACEGPSVVALGGVMFWLAVRPSLFESR